MELIHNEKSTSSVRGIRFRALKVEEEEDPAFTQMQSVVDELEESEKSKRLGPIGRGF